MTTKYSVLTDWEIADAPTAPQVANYGLPHAPNRPGQRETIEWLRGLPQGSTVVTSAPTGSGKTSFAAALGWGGGGDGTKAVALVKTKSLQVENYGRSYAFAVMKGKSNYDCANGDAFPGATANDCLFSNAMPKCPASGQCDYLHAKSAARASQKTSLNYAYWLTAWWPRAELAELSKGGRAALVMDEAHQLSDITLDHTSCTVSMRDRLAWDLPSFPILHGQARPEDVAVADEWIEQTIRTVWAAIKPLAEKRDKYAETESSEYLLDESEQKTLTAGERLRGKLEAVGAAMSARGDDWYIRSGPGTLSNAGAPLPGFVARPLTARYHFPGLFLGPWTSVMMSATIGDAATFTEELGIERYLYRDIPNQFTPDQRPVFALPAPAMGQKNRYDEAVLSEQARVIADAIKTCPREWSGIIHVTRKTEATELRQRLAHHGIGARLWTPKPTDSTDWAMRDWQRFKGRVTGAIAITWAWWEGYDGVDEKICIVAKTPFPNLADDYERARMAYSGTMFLQRTAWNLEQALGRTRRGNVEDYDGDGQRRGLVAIADGNWTRARKYMSPGLQQAIIEGQP